MIFDLLIFPRTTGGGAKKLIVLLHTLSTPKLVYFFTGLGEDSIMDGQTDGQTDRQIDGAITISLFAFLKKAWDNK